MNIVSPEEYNGLVSEYTLQMKGYKEALMKIGMIGAGTMAKVVANYIKERNEQGEQISCLGMAELLGGGSIDEAFKEVPEVLIDFSNPANIEKTCGYAKEHGIPAVIATTGCSEDDEATIRKAAETVPIVYSANYSLGITVIEKAVEEMTRTLAGAFDIEIIEQHHRRKLDAPSGTALLLARAVQRGGIAADENGSGNGIQYEFTYGRYGSSLRRKEEIGVHAVRGGGIVGEHTVLFAGDEEVIEIRHHAQSKRIFAVGALKAAKFALSKEAGLYQMKDVLWTQEQS